MKRVLIACLLSALVITCGCGSSNHQSQSSSVLTYVERPAGNESNAKLYVMNTSSGNSTPVSITFSDDIYRITPTADGKTVAYFKFNGGSLELDIMPVGGSEKKLATLNDWGTFISISPDSKTLVYQDGTDLYTVGTDGLAPKLLTSDAAADGSGPAFSPDGKTIAFYLGADGAAHSRVGLKSLAQPASTNAPASGIYTMPVSGGTPTLVYSSESVMGTLGYSEDGKKIFFPEFNSVNGSVNISSIGVDGSGHAVLVSSTVATLLNPVAFGNKVFYNEVSTDYSNGIMTFSIDSINLDGTGKATLKSSTTSFVLLRDVWDPET